jgi:hypothetical protein
MGLFNFSIKIDILISLISTSLYHVFKTLAALQNTGGVAKHWRRCKTLVALHCADRKRMQKQCAAGCKLKVP